MAPLISSQLPAKRLRAHLELVLVDNVPGARRLEHLDGYAVRSQHARERPHAADVLRRAILVPADGARCGAPAARTRKPRRHRQIAVIPVDEGSDSGLFARGKRPLAAHSGRREEESLFDSRVGVDCGHYEAQVHGEPSFPGKKIAARISERQYNYHIKSGK